MIERLRGRGVSVSDAEQCAAGSPEALGRRHLAEMLVRARAGRPRCARRSPASWATAAGVAVPKLRLPVAEALALVRAAGGVAA